MWYLVKVKGKWQAIYYNGTYSDSIYSLLMDCGVQVDGQFGRKEFAEHWAAVNNKEEGIE